MVLCGDHQILHACLFRRADKDFCVKLSGVECLEQLSVIFTGNLGLALDPFGIAPDTFLLPHSAELGIETKVDEHPILGIREPLHARIVVLDGFFLESGFLRGCGR